MDIKLEGPEYVAVYEVIGEPAIVINGVPPLPSESAAPVQLHTVVNTGGDCDQFFGDWLEGREIRKLFGDQYYSGTVDKYDDEENWYRVTYEDGDFEDLEWRELEEVLVPLDISVPLTTLALRQCKIGGDASLTKMNLTRKSRGRPKSLRSTEKTIELLQSAEAPRMAVENSQEIILNTGQNVEHNLLGQTTHKESGDSISKPDNPDRYKGVESVKMMEMLPIPCEAELTGSIPVQVLVNEEIVTEETSWRQK